MKKDKNNIKKDMTFLLEEVTNFLVNHTTEHQDVTSHEGLLMNTIHNLNSIYNPKIKKDSNIIDIADCEFVHPQNLSFDLVNSTPIRESCDMSFGLYVDKGGNGYISISSAAREGTPCVFDRNKNKGRKIDIYSKDKARKLIVSRLNHYFGNSDFEHRAYTPSQIYPIGKVFDKIEYHTKMTKVISQLIETCLTVPRKAFVMTSLSLIELSMNKGLDPNNTTEVCCLIDKFYSEIKNRSKNSIELLQEETVTC